MTIDEIDQLLGADGPFAHAFPSYEPRRGQIDGAKAIVRAVQRERNVALEAPTGTGKSVMYLVPLLMDLRDNPREIVRVRQRRDGREVDEDQQDDAEDVEKEVSRRIVVSTANTSLQDQLVQKDLPLLAKVLPWKFQYSLLKGRSNYLCLDALRTVKNEGLAMAGGDVDDELSRFIEDWAEQTKTGDKNEIARPIDRLWGRYSVGGDECHGHACDYYEECWQNLARAAARDADVIVTNHSMLALHLRLLEDTGAHILLPRFSTLVIDEAHELANYSRSAWGFKLSQGSVSRALAPWRTLMDQESRAAIQQVADDIGVRIARFVGEPRFDPRVIADDLHGLYRMLVAAAEKIDNDIEERRSNGHVMREDAQAHRKGSKRVDSLLGRIVEIVGLPEVEQPPNPNLVYWVERDRDRPPVLLAEPMEVGDRMRRVLFDRVPTAVVTSATLTTGGEDEVRWRYVENQIGLVRHDRHILASPFDISHQLRVCLPSMPMPDEREQWEKAVPLAVEQAILQARGRTLVLFTSNKMMEAVYEQLTSRGKIPYRIMKQREAPTRVLLQQFKQDVHSVLLGVASLWTGIDVPGEALSCLVIDRLPFTHQNDPLVTAFRDRYGEGRCFDEMLLPDAILRFRQGVGRLIRTTSDIGVVVVLDRRVQVRRYGSRFLSFGVPIQYVGADAIGRFLDGGHGGEDGGVSKRGGDGRDAQSGQDRQGAQVPHPAGPIVRRAMGPAKPHP